MRTIQITGHEILNAISGKIILGKPILGTRGAETVKDLSTRFYSIFIRNASRGKISTIAAAGRPQAQSLSTSGKHFDR